VAPEISSSTGTLAARAVLDNKDHVLLPGLFVRVRIPKQVDVPSLLVPDVALGNNQQGRYLLIVNDQSIVEQRQVEVGEEVDGSLRIITGGLKPGERVVVGGLMRALPGNKVVPVTAAAAAEKTGK
jgi:membrane fusion protein, multidrug efflux system